MNTYNIGFYGEQIKIIFQLSSNIYASYQLFCYSLHQGDGTSSVLVDILFRFFFQIKIPCIRVSMFDQVHDHRKG